MGRTSDGKQRLVEASHALMQRNGFATVGVAEICARAEVNKGSFYYFFKSKQALTAAVIDRHATNVCASWETALGGAGAPLARLEAHLNGIYHRHQDAKSLNGVVLGCMLGNLALERSTLDPAIREQLAAVFSRQQQMLADVLSEAEALGHLDAAVTPEGGAQAIVALMEGMILLAKLRDDPEALRDLGQLSLRLVAAPPSQ
ncbi:MAG: TetR/AcrR family transcriptional repressor of nem operon [Myxococcota bacterium]|jgi:TetR/AcrR family transcriptional repressor of nem operon